MGEERVRVRSGELRYGEGGLVGWKRRYGCYCGSELWRQLVDLWCVCECVCSCFVAVCGHVVVVEDIALATMPREHSMLLLPWLEAAVAGGDTRGSRRG